MLLIIGAITLFLAVGILARNRFPYFLNLWYAFDMFCNAVLAGDPTETMSSRLGKAKRAGNAGARIVCWCLSLIDPGHCDSSVDEAKGGRSVPAGMMFVGLVWIVVVAVFVYRALQS